MLESTIYVHRLYLYICKYFIYILNKNCSKANDRMFLKYEIPCNLLIAECVVSITFLKIFSHSINNIKKYSIKKSTIQFFPDHYKNTEKNVVTKIKKYIFRNTESI